MRRTLASLALVLATIVLLLPRAGTPPVRAAVPEVTPPPAPAPLERPARRPLPPAALPTVPAAPAPSVTEGRISGVVVDAGGQPFACDAVTLGPAPDGRGVTPCDPDGGFRFAPLRPGRYHLFTADGARRAQVTLDLDAGETLDGVVLVLAPPDRARFPFRFVLRDERGPIEGIAVVFHDRGAGLATLDAAGAGMTSLPADVESVCFSVEGYLSRCVPASTRDPVRLERGQRVTGRVRDASGAPSAGLTVACGEDESVTDEDGRFTITCPRGSATLTLDDGLQVGLRPGQGEVEIVL